MFHLDRNVRALEQASPTTSKQQQVATCLSVSTSSPTSTFGNDMNVKVKSYALWKTSKLLPSVIYSLQSRPEHGEWFWMKMMGLALQYRWDYY
jgi:hypothetical protein